MANSKDFPEIDYKNFASYVKKAEECFRCPHDHDNPAMGKVHNWKDLFEEIRKNPIDGKTSQRKARVELVFIRATRNDATTGLSSCLCRSELMDALVRLS